MNHLALERNTCEPVYGTKERDFIFIRKPHAEAFFQGYANAEIDWSLLTYYLWNGSCKI